MHIFTKKNLMKRLLSLLLIFGAIYAASCNKDDSPTVVVIPKEDSVTRNSSFNVKFDTTSVFIRDLAVQNSPIYSITCRLDSVSPTRYYLNLVVTDHKKNLVTTTIRAFNNTSDPLGDYFVTEPNSTLTDYTKGENKTYSIAIGSKISITNPFYPLTGTFAINLYYNHKTIPATGAFKVYNSPSL